jgi:hypothetical protein
MKRPLLLSLREAARSKRSPLYGWMIDNHDSFAVVLHEAVRPNWAEIARTFGAQGLTDANGQPPTEETTRQTWWKVRKTVKARQVAAQAKQSAASVPLPTPTPPQPVAAPAVAPSAPVVRSGFDPATLRPARLKSGWPSEEK